jgi:hypothetical protein
MPVLKANKLFKRTFSWYLKNLVWKYIQSFACKCSVDEEIVQSCCRMWSKCESTKHAVQSCWMTWAFQLAYWQEICRLLLQKCNVKCDLLSTAVGILILLFLYVKWYNLKFFEVAVFGSKVTSGGTGPPCPVFIFLVSYSKSSKPVAESCFCGGCFSLLLLICYVWIVVEK